MSAPVIIIGGGAAGLAAAAFSKKALVLERLSRPGVKVLATGGGRCNMTHDASVEEMLPLFGRHGRFAAPALRTWPPDAIRAWLRERHVPTLVEADGSVFPASGRASDVREALVSAAQAAGADIRCGIRVTRICVDAGRSSVTGVETETGETIRAQSVILAAGGQAQPGLGSDGSSFALAGAVGLAVTSRVPALAGLHVADPWVRALAGVTCEAVAIRLAVRGQPRDAVFGSLLFTHTGVSGPPALAISGSVAQILAETGSPARIEVAWLGDRTATDWRAWLDDWRRTSGGRLVRSLLGRVLPNALACALCEHAGLPPQATVARLTREETDRLVRCCSACPLEVIGTDGWNRAMLTCGGVARSALDPKTMACKAIGGLYCAGECVDLDAPCGGYNLTWALASGKLAGESVLRGVHAAPRQAGA